MTIVEYTGLTTGRLRQSRSRISQPSMFDMHAVPRPRQRRRGGPICRRRPPHGWGVSGGMSRDIGESIADVYGPPREPLVPFWWDWSKFLGGSPPRNDHVALRIITLTLKIGRLALSRAFCSKIKVF